MIQNNPMPGVHRAESDLINQEKTFTSSDLLGASSSVLINHRGVIYTLRLTQFGKLILTK